jgi:hypothetical protein
MVAMAALSCVTQFGCASTPPPRRNLALDWRIGTINTAGVFTPLSGLPVDWTFSDPIISPDGKMIAMTGIAPLGPGRPRLPAPATPSSIVIYTLPHGPATILDIGHRDILPAWVPGTDLIAFNRSTSALSGNRTIMLGKADGSEPPRAVLTTPLMISSSAWFPDGRRAIIGHNGIPAERDGRLVTFSLDQPDSLNTILRDGMMNSHPALSPDGSMLAYVTAPRVVSERGTILRGTPRVVIHRFADRAQATIAFNNSTHPQWSASGEYLFFQAGSLYKVRVHNRATLQLQGPSAVSPHRFSDPASRYAVLPGDSLFVIRHRVPPLLSREIDGDEATREWRQRSMEKLERH